MRWLTEAIGIAWASVARAAASGVGAMSLGRSRVESEDDKLGSLPGGCELLEYKSADLMIFGRPQVGLDAAVSAGGRGRTPALSARQRRRKFWAIFLYSRHFQLTVAHAPGFVK